MCEDLNKPDGKRAAMLIALSVLAVIIFAMIYFNVLGFANLLENGGVKPARLYGGIFCACIGLVPFMGLRSALRDTPFKSLEKYAKKTQDPEATLKRLLETWENGFRFNDRSRIDEAYLIMFINRTHANVVPFQDIVWAYKM